MKKFLLFIIPVLMFQHSNAQCQLEGSFLRPTTSGNGMFIQGWGGELSFYSPQLRLPYLPGFRIGTDLYMAGLGHSSASGITLLPPQTGSANVKVNTLLEGIDLDIRFSFGLGHYASLYTGASFGVRQLQNVLTIHSGGNNPTSDTSLLYVAGIDYGFSGGVLIPLGETVRINLGVQWTHSEVPGTLIDLHSISNQSGTLNYSEQDSPYDMVMGKVGVVVNLDDVDLGDALDILLLCGSSGHSSSGGGHSHISTSHSSGVSHKR